MWRHRSGRRRRRRFDVHGRRRRRRLIRRTWALAGAAFVMAVLGAVALHQGLRARTQLIGARAALQQAVDNPAALATPEGRVAAAAQVNSALDAIQSARRDVAGSPVLSLAAVVPGLHGQRAGVLQLIDDSAAAAAAGRDLLATVDGLADRNQIRDGTLPLDALGQLQAQVHTAGQAIAGRVRSSNHLWGPLGDARRQFDDVARSSAQRLLNGADAIGAARTFLGAGGSRRYLVALQNNAEMRDQGIVLSYVPLTVSDGHLTFEKGGSIADLTLDRPTATVLPDGTQAVFGPAKPTQRWTAVNASADFTVSGRSMVDMYHQATGQSVDGVIAVDVPGLASLLSVVGPVSIEGRSDPITADNAGQVLLHDFYDGLGPVADQAARRERLGDVLKVVGDRLTTGSRDAVSLGRQLGQAATGGHLHLFSLAGDEEGVFERTGLGGGPATVDADRTFHVAVENRSGTKVDYYVQPTIRQDVTLTPQGSAVVHTTVTVDNRAPVNAAPSYQLGPDEFTKKPGDYLAWVLLWAPSGSTMQSATAESGLNLANYVAMIGAGEQRQFTFDTVIPNAVRDGKLRLRLVPQARLQPPQLDVRLQAPGWSVSGAQSWQGAWDSVRTFEWSVHKG
jgi:hypothetical protein